MLRESFWRTACYLLNGAWRWITSGPRCRPRDLPMEAALLKGFEEELAVYHDLGIVDYERLGRDAADSFVVTIAHRLAASPKGNVPLAPVGTLWRKGEDVAFEAYKTLPGDLKNR